MARIRGTNASEQLFGFEVADLIDGRHGDDRMFGQGGNDFIRGRLGNDEVQGGFGNDRIWGDAGNDLLYAGDDFSDSAYAGWDEIHGGQGNDRIIGVNGFATGDRGDDYLEWSNGRAEGGLGNDTFQAAVGLGRYLVQVGGQGADLFSSNVLVQSGGGVQLIADFNPGEGDRLSLSFVNVVTGESMDSAAIRSALDSNGSGIIGDGDPQIAQPGSASLPEQNAILLGFEHSLIIVQGVTQLSTDWIV